MVVNHVNCVRDKYRPGEVCDASVHIVHGDGDNGTTNRTTIVLQLLESKSTDPCIYYVIISACLCTLRIVLLSQSSISFVSRNSCLIADEQKRTAKSIVIKEHLLSSAPIICISIISSQIKFNVSC